MEELPTIVWMQYGPHLESPWQCREAAKERFKKKIASQSGELAPHLVMKKAHIQKNGWALKLFFLHVPDHLHAKMLEIFQHWAGDGGAVRMLSEEETSTQLVSDESFKFKRQKEETELGDLERVAGIMQQCLLLQGKPVDGDKKNAKCQRETARLVAQVVDRAQAYKAYKEKSMRKKPRANLRADPESHSDSDV